MGSIPIDHPKDENVRYMEKLHITNQKLYFNAKFTIIVVLFILILVITTLHFCTKEELSCFFFNFGRFLYPINPFEIELIGSGMIAFIISLVIYFLSKESTYNQKKTAIKEYFGKVIMKDIKRSFRRSTSMLNTSSGINSKFYYDNSEINHVHDVIEKHIEMIYEYLQYHIDETARRLLEFHTECEDGYIKGEELDTLLIDMASLVGIVDTNNENNQTAEIIFWKATNICEYDKFTVVARFNKPHKNIFHEVDPIDFIIRYFSGEQNSKRTKMRNDLEKLKNEILKSRRKLLKQSINIRQLNS